MDTKRKIAWVKSRGIRNKQVGNTREVPAHGEYSDRKSLWVEGGEEKRKVRKKNTPKL